MKPTEIILDNTNPNPTNKEIYIEVPDGYEIDRENSTFKCIKLKPIIKSKFSDYDGTHHISGYWLYDGITRHLQGTPNKTCHKDVFATEKQAKSALAMAQISQIMANDKRFGGIIEDKEWEDFSTKYVIIKHKNELHMDTSWRNNRLLAFHTEEQRDLFLKENEQLVKDYLMID